MPVSAPTHPQPTVTRPGTLCISFPIRDCGVTWPGAAIPHLSQPTDPRPMVPMKHRPLSGPILCL